VRSQEEHDQRLGACVGTLVGQLVFLVEGVGGHGDRAEALRGEEGDHELRHVGQHDRYAVALAHAEVVQRAPAGDDAGHRISLASRRAPGEAR